jgi:hypothetical protein
MAQMSLIRTGSHLVAIGRRDGNEYLGSDRWSVNDAPASHVLSFGMFLDDLIYLSVALLRNVDSSVTTPVHEDPALLLVFDFGSIFFHGSAP